MVRDAFLMEELVRIDCKGLERSDYKKIGVKLRVRFPFASFMFEICLVLPGITFSYFLFPCFCIMLLE